MSLSRYTGDMGNDDTAITPSVLLSITLLVGVQVRFLLPHFATLDWLSTSYYNPSIKCIPINGHCVFKYRKMNGTQEKPKTSFSSITLGNQSIPWCQYVYVHLACNCVDADAINLIFGFFVRYQCAPI